MPADPRTISCQEDLIRHVPLFSDLSDAEAGELWQSAQRRHAAPGELVIREGETGDSLFIVLSGTLEVTKRDGGRDVPLATRAGGDFIGEMSLIEAAPRTASVRALTPTELLVIGPDDFRRMLDRRPGAATTVLRTVAARLRSTEASLVQSDRLAALGTLAAGLAHELNNPAAAIQRSVSHLREAQETAQAAARTLGSVEPGEAVRALLSGLEQRLAAPVPFDDLAARRGEEAIAAWLEDAGIAEPWDFAPALAGHGWTVADLDAAGRLPGDESAAILRWLGTALLSRQLLAEIETSARAISGIVRAVKSYAYLDQAPVQDVDIARSIEDTLMILRHKLKAGVDVVRGFPADLPRIEAYGGELNQVWTNLVDNAVQAMEGTGRLEVGARAIGDEIEVRIADSGPGIPDDVRRRMFDPFFTTKPQGIGTGLGLHVVHNIVVNRHGGRIDVETRPGRTEFRVVLPLRLPAQRGGDAVPAGHARID